MKNYWVLGLKPQTFLTRYHNNWSSTSISFTYCRSYPSSFLSFSFVYHFSISFTSLYLSPLVNSPSSNRYPRIPGDDIWQEEYKPTEFQESPSRRFRRDVTSCGKYEKEGAIGRSLSVGACMRVAPLLRVPCQEEKKRNNRGGHYGGQITRDSNATRKPTRNAWPLDEKKQSRGTAFRDNYDLSPAPKLSTRLRKRLLRHSLAG